MHIVTLSTLNPPKDERTYMGRVWKDFTEAKKHKSRIYRIYIDASSEDKRFVLMTASKDLYLKLGSFEWRCNHNLAKFLEEEFENSHCSQFLLCLKGESENSEEGILVNKTVERGEIIFTLVPVR